MTIIMNTMADLIDYTHQIADGKINIEDILKVEGIIIPIKPEYDITDGTLHHKYDLEHVTADLSKFTRAECKDFKEHWEGVFWDYCANIDDKVYYDLL